MLAIAAARAEGAPVAGTQGAAPFRPTMGEAALFGWDLAEGARALAALAEEAPAIPAMACLGEESDGAIAECADGCCLEELRGIEEATWGGAEEAPAGWVARAAEGILPEAPEAVGAVETAGDASLPDGGDGTAALGLDGFEWGAPLASADPGAPTLLHMVAIEAPPASADPGAPTLLPMVALESPAADASEESPAEAATVDVGGVDVSAAPVPVYVLLCRAVVEAVKADLPAADEADEEWDDARLSGEDCCDDAEAFGVDEALPAGAASIVWGCEEESTPALEEALDLEADLALSTDEPAEAPAGEIGLAALVSTGDARSAVEAAASLSRVLGRILDGLMTGMRATGVVPPLAEAPRAKEPRVLTLF
jgi:hypothetical protein